MQHPVNDFVVNQTVRSLIALKGLLKKAQLHAEEKKFDPNLFLQTRLSPDMFPLVRQVQIACDSAKFAASRLTGKTAPAFPDEEKTLDELQTRIDKTINYLREFSEKDFEGYKDRKATFSFRPGVYLTGEDYFTSHVIPNFYFHMTTTYALLRENGVAIGKNDFLGEQNWHKEA